VYKGIKRLLPFSTHDEQVGPPTNLRSHSVQSSSEGTAQVLAPIGTAAAATRTLRSAFVAPLQGGQVLAFIGKPSVQSGGSLRRPIVFALKSNDMDTTVMSCAPAPPRPARSCMDRAAWPGLAARARATARG
jgi:hypothetical protein